MPPVWSERKVITALFCDVVGPTELGERPDQEEFAALMGEYERLCRQVVEAHGGVVEKFIGDAVVTVFGVPAAHEDDPERAVRAGLRIVQRLSESDVGVQVRVGMQSGEALNMAARIEASFDGGIGYFNQTMVLHVG